ncbi:MAG TPA: OmpA family protein [bacterium]|jgi:outer membrane protein OmpA-like peptidoglycan-associated protein
MTKSVSAKPSHIRSACLFSVFCFLLFALPALAQTATSSPDLDSLLAKTGAALADARSQGLDLLSPRHFEKAQAAYDEARSLIAKKSQEDLTHIRLKLAQDELESARTTASSAQQKLGDVLDARSSALAAGADTLSQDLWRKADDRFRAAVRDFEKSPSGNIKAGDLIGSYRKARLEALRNGILKGAREKLAQMDHKRAEKDVPVMVLRSQQAMSRAEADVAKDNLDAARIDARIAEREATHALSMIDYIEKVRKTKQPWETAVLPYDDLLDSVASYLGGSMDYSRGVGVYSLSQLISLIRSRQDSLQALTTHQQQTLKSLEASLSDAQTKLADATNRISEMQSRLGMATTPAQGAAATEQMARAQSVFRSGEASVLQGENGSVIIRLAGSLFPAGATKLDKARQKVLDRAADAISLFPGAAIRVEGHTDSVGTAEKNQTVSTERAQSVASYLVAKLKVTSDRIPAQGYGSTRPVAPNATPEGRARNRRVDIVLTVAK